MFMKVFLPKIAGSQAGHEDYFPEFSQKMTLFKKELHSRFHVMWGFFPFP